MAARVPGELRVLVVEDQPDDYDILVGFLKRESWRIHSERVEDEPGLRAALADADWDIVISDHHLPRFDSISALRVLREVDEHVPFIIVSGHIGEQVAVNAMLSGADDYVMKHSLARLHPAIHRCLEASAVRREKAAAESAKRESDARLAATAANLPGAVFQLRQRLGAGTIEVVYLSRGAEALLGRPVQAVIDKPALLTGLTAEGDEAPLSARMAASAAVTEPLSWEGRAGAQGERWLALRALPRSLAPGVVLWDGVMMDISALKRAEAGLRESRQQLSELSAHWEQRVEEERSGIARELHDDFGGSLTALKVDLDWLRRHRGEDPEVLDKSAAMQGLVESLLQATTRIARDLRPAALDYGICIALETRAAELERRLGISCRFRTNSENLEVEPAVARALFRIFQESLTNITKHALAKNVEIELFATPEAVTLEVRDDGRGFAAGDLCKGGSFGVRGMQERAGRLGGWLEVNGMPGKGTIVMASIPLGGKGAT